MYILGQLHYSQFLLNLFLKNAPIIKIVEYEA